MKKLIVFSLAAFLAFHVPSVAYATVEPAKKEKSERKPANKGEEKKKEGEKKEGRKAPGERKPANKNKQGGGETKRSASPEKIAPRQ